MTINEQWRQLTAAALADETACIARLRDELADFPPEQQQAASRRASAWIGQLRQQPGPGGVEALLQEYRLGSAEGVALMTLAEALLRIPEPATADELIRDLLAPVDWHQGQGGSLFANATRWGLALTGRWLATSGQASTDASGWLQRWSSRLGEPLLRRSLKRAMRYLAQQFVLGSSLDHALHRARADWADGVTHSFDMLGEAALTAADAERFAVTYRQALHSLGSCQPPEGLARPSISVKLSALHPRYETAKWQQLQRQLLPVVAELAELAAAAGAEVTLDAEEADRLELSLALFERLYESIPAARGRVGLAVQAYSMRAMPTLQWLGGLASRHGVTIPLRLVKGAYWDSEIKKAQQRGLDGYPVFTHKQHTDIAYLACGRWLLSHPEQFFPQFATHNALTIASLLGMRQHDQGCEFQRLHGMGRGLYECVRQQHPSLRLRIYAPVGEYRELLPYLVRRLLENGANSSFVNQLHDLRVPAPALAEHPLQQPVATGPGVTPPAELFAPRHNSAGVYLHSENARVSFLHALNAFRGNLYQIGEGAGAVAVRNPYNGEPVGHWQPATPDQMEAAVTTARSGQPAWQRLDVDQRAACIERAADLLQTNRAELVALMARECGKTIEAALDEVRETVDLCRYYAEQARALLAPRPLPGPAGEENRLLLEARGLQVCISPWNFPLAIFTGQIVAALVTGNAVLAKPAQQATLTASLAIRLLHRAGIPEEVLPLLPGGGDSGAVLCGRDDIDGVVFTGGIDTARAIARQLAQRRGALVPLIAETAGLNAMIADSSTLPQQLVMDVMRSAFDSAGQRCSALRVLYLPRSCSTQIETLLHGAMRELQLGDPLEWSSDIGPVIDHQAHTALLTHIERFRCQGRLLYQTPLPDGAPERLLVPPTTLRLERLRELEREPFGPVLHLIRYDEADVDGVIDDINASGYGLTAGIHTRNEAKAQRLAARLRVGNCYINRDMVGAVVGSQPFGGRGLSGTGPKAGGPLYLTRFVNEKCITLNSAALGGDQRLLSRPD